ncbi:MAG: glycosyltransferase family 2 protein [Planctomycetota bacterium]
MPPPIVSVVIPAFNAAHCVAEAIESVRSQTMDGVEILVVDDGSTDATSRIVQAFGNSVRYLPQSHRGVAAARNTGLRAARGRFVAFLDADDEFAHRKLAVQVTALEAEPAAVAHAVNTEIVLAGGERYNLFVLLHLVELAQQPQVLARPLATLLSWAFFLQSVMIRADVIAKTGILDPRLRAFDELDFLGRVALAGPWLTTPQTLVHVLRKGAAHGNLSTVWARHPVQKYGSLVRIYRRLKARPELTRAERRMVVNRAGSAAWELGAALVERRHRRWSMPWFGAALRARPSAKMAAKTALAVAFGRAGVDWVRRTRAPITVQRSESAELI